MGGTTATTEDPRPPLDTGATIRDTEGDRPIPGPGHTRGQGATPGVAPDVEALLITTVTTVNIGNGRAVDAARHHQE